MILCSSSYNLIGIKGFRYYGTFQIFNYFGGYKKYPILAGYIIYQFNPGP